MDNIVRNSLKKSKILIVENKKWVISTIIIPVILVPMVTIILQKCITPKGEQLLNEIRICYVNAERLSEFKEKGEISGKKINMIENRIIKIVEKWTLPGSYIGFLVLEVEKDLMLSITNLDVPYKLQIDSLYNSTKYASQNTILNKKNSVYIKDKYQQKSLNPDAPMILFPFCITSEMFDNGSAQDKIHESFNNSNHIIMYYHISEIKYKTNGSNKWQTKRVEPMKSVVFFE